MDMLLLLCTYSQGSCGLVTICYLLRQLWKFIYYDSSLKFAAFLLILNSVRGEMLQHNSYAIPEGFFKTSLIHMQVPFLNAVLIVYWLHKTANE